MKVKPDYYINFNANARSPNFLAAQKKEKDRIVLIL